MPKLGHALTATGKAGTEHAGRTRGMKYHALMLSG